MPRKHQVSVDSALRKILQLLLWLPVGQGLTKYEILHKTGLTRKILDGRIKQMLDLGWLIQSNTRPNLWRLSEEGLVEATRLLQQP